MGIEADKETVILYQNPDNCEFCFDVEEKLENIHTINECCLKFKVNGLESYICDLDAYRCDMSIKQISKYFFKKCLDLNKNALQTHSPGYCIIDKKTPLNYFPEKSSKRDLNEGKMLEKIAMEHLKSIQKSFDLQKLIEIQLVRVNQEITKLDKKVISTLKNNEETINFNSDGTQTIIKKDGTRIIQNKNNSINVILNNDHSIEINYFDGAKYFIKASGENVFHLPNNILINIKEGNYEIKNHDLHFQLFNNQTAILKERDEKTTLFENNDNISTILKDGTKITKKLST